ncbi:uncharacterized protein LOC136064101 [Quercus suber]|uniref:uncharacterized protein LOC136064101 n=1 Tax=Quercus suber TaxID=58331 RepID=UPI0032E021EC
MSPLFTPTTSPNSPNNSPVCFPPPLDRFPPASGATSPNLSFYSPIDRQTLGDKPLRKLAFSHVIHSIKRMNQKHKNDAKNRKLQNIVFAMLLQDDEAKAKRALTTLCELHRRKLWFDDRTANAIATHLLQQR